MKVVAGLGNPGTEYANTPHSVGFEVVDELARMAGAEWRRQNAFKGDLADCVAVGGKVKLLKPMTFMNLSGDSVAPVVKYSNATAADLIVVSDDIDLPVGRIRIRRGGSAGGHNGLRSVIERLGTPDFVRVRVGVGRDARGPHSTSKVIGHVLGKFSPQVRATMDQCVAAAAQAVLKILADGPEVAMNAFNGWAPEGGAQ